MKIALDARWLQYDAGGVGRTVRGVLPHLDAAVELHFLTDPRKPALVGVDPVRVHPLAAPWPHHSAVWLQVAAPRWLRGWDGIFHCPWYGLPYRQPVPMVATIHDIVFETHPEWFRRSRRLAFRAQARHAARTARRLIAVSHNTADAVADRYGVARERIVVAPNSVSAPFGRSVRADEIDGLRRRLGLDGRYVVALGGAPRRQLWVAVEAVRRARMAHPDLLLAALGPERARGEGVVALPRLTDDDLVVLLTGAEALCYPTRFEGFGMPALEAAACGTPVVAAPVGALPEVLADAAEWCEEPEVDPIAAGLLRVLGDPSRAEALRRASRQRAQSWPGWDHAARQILRAYAEAVS